MPRGENREATKSSHILFEKRMKAHYETFNGRARKLTSLEKNRLALSLIKSSEVRRKSFQDENNKRKRCQTREQTRKVEEKSTGTAQKLKQFPMFSSKTDDLRSAYERNQSITPFNEIASTATGETQS